MQHGQVGGSVDDMRNLGSTLLNESQQVQQLLQRITSAVEQTEWLGAAAERFRAQWHDEYARTLHAVHAGLEECAQEVQRRAEALQAAGG